MAGILIFDEFCETPLSAEKNENMKKEYLVPQVEVMHISVEQGFAATSTIDNPSETEDASAWS